MAEIAGVTSHTCEGTGELEKDDNRITVQTSLGLDPVQLDVQHFRDGATRVICEFINEDDGTCSKLRKASKQDALIALVGTPYVSKEDGDEEYTHHDGQCKWTKGAIEE